MERILECLLAKPPSNAAKDAGYLDGRHSEKLLITANKASWAVRHGGLVCRPRNTLECFEVSQCQLA